MMRITCYLIHYVPTQQGLHDLHCLACVHVNKSGAHLSESLDFTVSGPRRPARALLQDGDEAGDGFSVGAATDLPCFCHQGEPRRKQCLIYRNMYIYIKQPPPSSIPQLPLLMWHWIFNVSAKKVAS